jgi:hypothetical protein
LYSMPSAKRSAASSAKKRRADGAASSSSGAPSSSGRWFWKSSRSRPDSDDTAWTEFGLKDAKLLELNYTRSTAPYKRISGGRCVVYSDPVHSMAQYQESDPAAWRPVKRVGGPPIAFAHLQMRVIGMPYAAHYEVLGRFGEYKTDEYDSDTRWSDDDHSVSATDSGSGDSADDSDPEWCASDDSDEGPRRRRARERRRRQKRE